MDTEEFKKIMFTFRPQLLLKAKEWVDDEEQAEDMVQEVLLRLWEMCANVNGKQKLKLLAWKILKRTCIDQDKIKKNKYENIEDYNVISMEDNPHEQIETNDNMKTLMNIIEQLPELQRIIIRLKDIEGYELEEIADITLSSNDSVRVNLSRARKKVKEMFLKFNTL